LIPLQLFPVVLSLLVLGAHFLRAGNLVLVVLTVALLGLLPVRSRWAAHVIQTALVLGAVEWVRTLLALAVRRAEAGQPALRMVIILGIVALVTALSGLVFRSSRLRSWYGGGSARNT
jgi:hypothetical protein